MKKSLLTILGTVGLALSLAACGGGESSSSSSIDSSSEVSLINVSQVLDWDAEAMAPALNGQEVYVGPATVTGLHGSVVTIQSAEGNSVSDLHGLEVHLAEGQTAELRSIVNARGVVSSEEGRIILTNGTLEVVTTAEENEDGVYYWPSFDRAAYNELGGRSLSGVAVEANLKLVTIPEFPEGDTLTSDVTFDVVFAGEDPTDDANLIGVVIHKDISAESLAYIRVIFEGGTRTENEQEVTYEPAQAGMTLVFGLGKTYFRNYLQFQMDDFEANRYVTVAGVHEEVTAVSTLIDTAVSNMNYTSHTTAVETAFDAVSVDDYMSGAAELPTTIESQSTIADFTNQYTSDAALLNVGDESYEKMLVNTAEGVTVYTQSEETWVAGDSYPGVAYTDMIYSLLDVADYSQRFESTTEPGVFAINDADTKTALVYAIGFDVFGSSLEALLSWTIEFGDVLCNGETLTISFTASAILYTDSTNTMVQLVAYSFVYVVSNVGTTTVPSIA